MLLRHFLLLWLSVLQIYPLLAAERPKIGLALSGGGARGMAHVGVLRVLEQEQVPIDYIAGTSMGSIIGGLYASGMSLDDIEAALHEMDWAALFKDKEDRTDRSFRRKQDDTLYLANTRLGVKDGKVSIGTALIQGQKFDLALSRLTQHVTGITDFDALPIPFRAVATDLATGKEVVLEEGSLPLAMRASMSIPAAFAGVEIDGRLLADGGMANNLPISVVRSMGADIIIAVDISSPLYGKEDLDSALTVLEQLTGFLTRRNTERQLATLTERDILLVPELGDIGSASFKQVSGAIEAGVISATGKREQLALLAIPGKMPLKHPDMDPVPVLISKVEIVNDGEVGERALRQQLGVYPGEILDLDKLERGVSRVYGMGVFESVRYQLTPPKDGEQGVIIKAREKSWGTNFLQFGLELSSGANSGESFFNMGAAYTMQPLNELNGEWRTALQLGHEPGFFSEIYQPLDTEADYFLHGKFGYSNIIFRIFDGDQALAEYEASQWIVDLGAGKNLGNWGELRLGYRGYTGELELNTGIELLSGYNFTGGEMYARITIDDLDNLHFPRTGKRVVMEGRYSREYLGADDDFEQLQGRGIWASSWGDNTLVLAGEVGATRFNAAPLQNSFRLGGFLRLSGLEQHQLTGQQMALAEVVYMRRLYESRIVPVFAGASLEAGNAWTDSDAVSLDDIFVAGSLFLGMDTPIGPLYLAYGYAETGQDGIYLFLGQAWTR